MVPLKILIPSKFFLEKNLSETNFLRFRQSARKITVNFPVEKSEKQIIIKLIKTFLFR